MTLRDNVNGPEWVIWVVFAVFLILSVILLSGHGANLVAGYNTASKEEKAKYDSKKISRVVGIGMSIITILILAMGLFMDYLDVSFSYIFAVIVFADCITMTVLINTICRKSRKGL